jgi:hypothetical protein
VSECPHQVQVAVPHPPGVELARADAAQVFLALQLEVRDHGSRLLLHGHEDHHALDSATRTGGRRERVRHEEKRRGVNGV